MPKLKTHQSTKKRMKKSSTGKVLVRKPSSNHLLQKKSASRKRGFRGVRALSGGDKKNVAKRLG